MYCLRENERSKSLYIFYDKSSIKIVNWPVNPFYIKQFRYLTVLTFKNFELGFELSRRFVALFLSFPTHGRTPQLDNHIQSYGLQSKQGSICNKTNNLFISLYIKARLWFSLQFFHYFCHLI